LSALLQTSLPLRRSRSSLRPTLAQHCRSVKVRTARDPRDTGCTLSRQNVEILHEAVDAYSRNDVEAFLKTVHPDVEWHPFTAQAEGGGAYHGHDGVRRWWSNLVSNLDEFEASVIESRDLGDTVIAFARLRGQFKSGVALEEEIALVARYRDDLMVWGRGFRTRAEALDAVGLRADDARNA
jgi:ketosteroid isomerase-like protein